jgi:alginate O-acetyltransferase complex protein AlgJ
MSFGDQVKINIRPVQKAISLALPAIRFSTNQLFSVIFILILFVPLIKLIITPIAPVSAVEKRSLAPLPEVKNQDIRRIISGFETFFNDHFGFREELVAVQRYFLVQTGYSPQKQVVIGKQGWWYPADTVALYQNADPLTDQEKERLGVMFRMRQAWLHSLGIEYLLVIAPDKARIYPEYLPEGTTIINPGSHFDEFHTLMQENGVNIVNLKPALLAAKAQQDHLLYYKGDSHWNKLGAYVASLEMQEAINQLFPQDAPDNLVPATILPIRWTPDLGNFMGVGSLIQEDAVQAARPLQCGRYAEYHGNLDFLPDVHRPIMSTCETQRLHVYTTGDSYFQDLFPFFMDSFSEHIYVQDWYNQLILDSLLQERTPDLVIDEMVERRIYYQARAAILGYDVNSVSYGNPAWIFERMPNLYYQLSSYADLSALDTANIEILPPESSTSGMGFSSPSNDPQIVLPLDKAIPAHQLIAVKISVSSPDRTTFVLYYAPNDQLFEDHSVAARTIEPGLNEFIMVYYTTTEVKVLRMDPGNVIGQYDLQSVEVRAAAPDDIIGDEK